MRRRGGAWSWAVWVLFAAAAAAEAGTTEALLSGTRFKMRHGADAAHDSAAVKFRNDPALLAPLDPQCAGGQTSQLHLQTPNHDFGVVSLPCELWRPTVDGYTYSDRVGVAGGVRSIRYRSGSLSIRLKGPNFQAVSGPIGPVDVTFTVGAAAYCGRFASFVVNAAGKVRAAGPSAACDAPTPAPTATIVPTATPQPSCGDGIVSAGETCDDGNTNDGDCCNSTCGFDAAGTACAGDGNACTDDRCDGAGTCTHAFTASACDDGNDCTVNDRCADGVCGGTRLAPWINEVNYDGYDFLFPYRDHEEFVELAAPAGSDLAGYKLLSVEGTGTWNGALLCNTGSQSPGSAYFSATIPAGTVVGDDTGTGIGLVTLCFAGTSSDIQTAGRCDVVFPTMPSPESNLLNGAEGNLWECPDGALLLGPSGNFVDAVSWEGKVPNKGAYGGYFVGAPNLGRDWGDGVEPRRSLAKVSAKLGRETDAAQWNYTPTDEDSPGQLNPGESLTCFSTQAECGNGIREFGEDCEADNQCASGWHCVGCWCEPQVGASYTKTKYPIVLVHGLLGFDSLFGMIDYWHQIPEALESGGAQVFVVEVSQLNATAVRGEQLIQQIEQIVATTGQPKVNLIGHSHGGPTSRYAAAVRPDLVASVTSVAGPNTGADVADFITANFVNGSWTQEILTLFGGSLGNLLALLSGTTNPNDAVAAIQTLTTADMAAFNALYPQGMPATPCGDGPGLVNGIRYYSWTGTAQITTVVDPLDYLFALTSTLYSEPNDGLVGQCSSHLGRVIRDDYFHNHLDETNFMGLVPLTEVNPKTIFRDHANRLKNAGL